MENVNTIQLKQIIVKAAGFLFLLGLLTGVYVTMVATGKIDGSLEASLAAHLNGIIGSMLILSLLLILRYVKFGKSYKVIMVMMFIISNYFNWVITLMKSLLHVQGVQMLENSPTNNLIHIALILLVVIPALTGAVMWVFGTGSRRAT